MTDPLLNAWPNWPLRDVVRTQELTTKLAELAALRKEADGVKDEETLSRWVKNCLNLGIDPF